MTRGRWDDVRGGGMTRGRWDDVRGGWHDKGEVVKVHPMRLLGAPSLWHRVELDIWVSNVELILNSNQEACLWFLDLMGSPKSSGYLKCVPLPPQVELCVISVVHT